MCPEDTFKPDGLICGNSTGSLKCASGLCTNRDEQCMAYGEGDITGECKSFSGRFFDSLFSETLTFTGQCSLFCQSALNGCTKMTGYFRDGTPCGEAGTCSKGKCSIPDFGMSSGLVYNLNRHAIVGRIIEWILAHQNMSIGNRSSRGLVHSHVQ